MTDHIYRKQAAAATTIEEDWGRLTWLASGAVGNTQGLTVGRVTIKPGAANPRHGHNDCEEVLYLLAGRLRHTIGDETVILEAGDTLTVPAGTYHNAVNIGDADADMIVAYNCATRDFELEP
jgi:quercetin dioxygenase-like cupin family protein